MGTERMTLPNKAKLRNLMQYKDMSDEEFEEAMGTLKEEYEISPEALEEQIQIKWEELEKDYDLSDMKANDVAQIRSLILAQLQLEELERVAFALRKDASDATTVQVLDKINGITTRLVKNISDISSDLQITRKIRKQSKEASVIDAINDLKVKAKKFYNQRMLYVFCPECRMLLSTVWLNYNEEEHNSLHLKCNRCGNEFDQPLAPLYLSDNKNLEDVLIP